MNKSDVLFLEIFKSIRGDWSGGIENRGKLLADLILHTTLSDELKVFYLVHFKQMIHSYKTDRESFDGRTWSRDCINSYDDLEKTAWFNEKFYCKYTFYDADFSKDCPAFSGHNFTENQIMVQMQGLGINYKGLDSHTKDEIDKTKLFTIEFLGFDVEIFEVD